MSYRGNLDELGRALFRRRLGVVVGGSLSEGLTVKLEAGDVERGVPPGAVIEELAVGKYVVVEGASRRRFFSIVTDIALGHANPDLLNAPPDADDDFARHIYATELAFGRLEVAPMLVLEDGADAPKPVKTVPAHFSPVYEATPEDVARIFGGEDETHWHIGEPLDMENIKVNLDLKRFVERSSGVFGKSGTGKSFITRTILAGIVRANVAVNLIFDMHNDYGWAVRDEHGREYKGLRQLFGDGRVHVITLDPQTSRARGGTVDGVLQIGLDQIEPEDVEMLAGILGLSEVQVGALFYLRRKLGRDWVAQLLDEHDTAAVDALEDEEKIQSGTLRAIQRKFELFRRFDFLRETPPPQDMVEEIFNLLNRGKHVVLEFGVYGNTLAAYVLVANYLTRRIHARYVEEKNKAAGKAAQEPRPLVITIEEAHKFLDPEIAQHTIFGTIARELRKYNVTLLIVDQRPSGIDEEVMSQIGTRVTCLLDNEADIRAVFSGVSGASQLRQVLARLDTKQQALILGHAVPMPVVVKTREYGPELYKALGWADEATRKEQRQKDKAALWGEEN
ncbi:MAG: ATP-binding protein [Anaerolineales bacterium]|nr:ATP-binding protein [Anaerolineales bacterium]